MRIQICFAYHDGIIGGHFGIDKTREKIITRYYWKGMGTFIRDYVKSCPDCQTKKLEQLPKAGLLNPIQVEGPFEMVGIDFSGPFRVSAKGNRYIIVAIDHFTKWVECKALVKADQYETGVFIVENIIMRHGAPLKILSDRGTQFKSRFVKTICEMVGTKQVFTTAYHPQTNGLTERFNRTLAIMLSMNTNKLQSDWDLCIPGAVMAYNTAKQSSTGFSPFQLVYGKDPVLPPDSNESTSDWNARLRYLHKSSELQS